MLERILFEVSMFFCWLHCRILPILVPSQGGVFAAGLGLAVMAVGIFL